jgi:hypothetical protein
MSDRAVQDEVIRYLADSRFRAQEAHSAPISASEAAKANQFAHFLVRRYYRDRLARSFRYSHRFRGQANRIAEEIVDGAEFDHFLNDCVMGSLQAAQRVGEIARAHLSSASAPGAWWSELLDYEYSYFLQAATSEHVATGEHPKPGVSAVCRQFTWVLPEMLPRLRTGETIPDDLRREVKLLFSRTHTGRIYVVEVEPELERVFLATDGRSSVEKIAAVAGVPLERTSAFLTSLAEIGAVQI